MTRLHPDERPSKEQVVRDLRAWTQLASEPPVVDISEAQRTLKLKLKSALDERDEAGRFKDAAVEATRQLQELIRPIDESLKGLYDGAKIVQNDEMTQNLLKTHHLPYPREVIYRYQRCTLVNPFENRLGTSLRMSRSLELVNDGMLVLHLLLFVGPEGLNGVDYQWSLHPLATALVGTIECQQMLEEGVQRMAEQLKTAVDIFVQKLPDLSI